MQGLGAPESTRLAVVASMVPGERLELSHPHGRGILSPLRLPIPPPRPGDAKYRESPFPRKALARRIC